MVSTGDIENVLLAAVATMVGMSVTTILRFYLEQRLRRARGESVSYSERLATLIASLSKATREVDGILSELSDVAKDRAASVQALQTNLVALQGQERELRQQVELLQSIPVPVAEHFAKLVASGERRSARRDYMLFGAGVLVTTAITILLQLFVS